MKQNELLRLGAIFCFVLCGVSMLAVAAVAIMGAGVSVMSPPNNLILIERQTKIPLHIRYTEHNGLTIWSIAAIQVTLNSTGAVGKLEYSIENIAEHLYPMHKESGDVVVYREHPAIGDYEPVNTYFDMKITTDYRMFVIELAKEHPPGDTVKLHGMDISYLTK